MSASAEELARLRAKLSETTDPDIRAALEMRIAVLEPQVAAASAEPLAAEPEKPKVELAPEERERLHKELRRLESRVDGAEDEDVREALNREMVRINLLLSGLAPAVEDEAGPVQVPTATREQIEKAESLLREARVERMRNNNVRSDALMREAQETAPDAPEVLTALGDEMAERKQWVKAAESYRAALAYKPKDPALERKLAGLALRNRSMQNIDEALRAGLTDSPFLTPEDQVASARTATFLSFFLPGSGQVVMGKTWQGIAIFLTWALMLSWVFVDRDDLKHILSSAGATKGGGGSGGMGVLFPLMIALIVHISAVASCAGAAKRVAGRKSVSRPVPPMNLPFE